LILLAAVVVDIVMLHAEIRRHRAYERSTRPKLDPLVLEIKCDNTDALAKLDEITAAAQRAVVALGALDVNSVRLQNGVEQ
jgi:CRISPR/Cas system-associated endonuclease Cas3-HD